LLLVGLIDCLGGVAGDLPHLVDDYFPGQLRGQAVGDHPFNAAVCGNQLE